MSEWTPPGEMIVKPKQVWVDKIISTLLTHVENGEKEVELRVKFPSVSMDHMTVSGPYRQVIRLVETLARLRPTDEEVQLQTSGYPVEFPF